MTNLETEKHCVVLGGLDGVQFVNGLTMLRSELGRLEALVADLGDQANVGPAPIVSIGSEVDRDAIVVDHLDQSLTATLSRLIDLLALTRSARAVLDRAGVLMPA